MFYNWINLVVEPPFSNERLLTNENVPCMIGINALQFGKALGSSAITVGIGLALLGVYFIIKKVTKGGNNNEISQNAV